MRNKNLNTITSTENIQKDLSRLIRMSGSDEGFYVLSLHSFIEKFMRVNFPEYYKEDSFSENFWQYGQYIKNRTDSFIDGFEIFSTIGRAHTLTNRVRHEFGRLDVEEARSATADFLRFCRIIGIEKNDELVKLEQNLKLWDEKSSRAEDFEELCRVKFLLQMAKNEQKKLSERFEQYELLKVKSAGMEKSISELNLQLEAELNRTRKRKERIDQLRTEKNEIRQELHKIREEQNTSKEFESYLENLDRLTLYTRSRMDYERTLIRLTGEQKNIVRQLDFKNDFMIKGAAGTGKTLVLLEALKKLISAEQYEFSFNRKPEYLFLTYTTTLVKYDKYIAHILNLENQDSNIVTADSYFFRLFKKFVPDGNLKFDGIEEYYGHFNTSDFLTNQQLTAELEDFIYANNISDVEYLDQRIPRKEMKTPLNNTQRNQVWKIKDAIEKDMYSRLSFSRSFSRVMILEKLEKGTGISDCKVECVFIDETQDLLPVEMKVLKKLTSRCMIMAGDSDQSIYRSGSPFRRAGIDISGKTRILKINFRNTLPVHETAERFRCLSDNGFDETSEPEAFREGPPPELYSEENENKLLDTLKTKLRIFIEKIGYEPRNICILAPGTRQIKKLKEMISDLGLTASNIKDKSFDFVNDESIRLSTMHSSKGLDFPVVMLYLPELPYIGDFDKASAEKIHRNLVYVAMTRAMDNLNIFTLNSTTDQILEDLRNIIS